VDGAVAIEENVAVGRHASCDVHADAPGVHDTHATFHIDEHKYYVVDKSSDLGTWLNGKKIAANRKVQLHPGDTLAFGGQSGEGRTFKVKQMHVSQRDAGLLSCNNDGTPRRYRVSYRDERAGAASSA
jgi:pSer/pThr/pTyr-binding forkhead associated (FHA) protein